MGNSLVAHAGEFIATAGAKNGKAAATALAAMCNSCRTCHQQFK